MDEEGEACNESKTYDTTDYAACDRTRIGRRLLL